MKVKTVLELGDDFDEAIQEHLNILIAHNVDGAKNQEKAERQQFITNIRSKIHRAFKLGIEAGAKK